MRVCVCHARHNACWCQRKRDVPSPRRDGNRSTWKKKTKKETKLDFLFKKNKCCCSISYHTVKYNSVCLLRQRRVNQEVHISETTSLQMSCAAALVAVMGKLYREEGHTQLESGEFVGCGWQEVGRETGVEGRR